MPFETGNTNSKSHQRCYQFRFEPRIICFNNIAQFYSDGWNSGLVSILSHVSERLVKGYAKYISTTWPILHSIQFRDLDMWRHLLKDPFEISTLSLVYAISGRFVETPGELGDSFPERHYKIAMQYLQHVLQFQIHDIKSVQTLLLHAVYCLRVPKRPGAWWVLFSRKDIHCETYWL
jgi:hypothetical protein